MTQAVNQVGDKPLALILQSENPTPSGTYDEAKDLAEKIQILHELYPGIRFSLIPFKYTSTDDGGMSLESILAIAELEPQ
jgi:hypothetical protein